MVNLPGVNLLAHYYLDHDHPSAYFKLGLLLPDLIAGFNQKLRRAVFASQPARHEHRELAEGIKKHYAADRAFHGSGEFAFYSALVQRALDAQRFPAFQHRRYFLAHVFVELLLDRLLVKHAPQLCVKIYSDLEETDAGVLQSYFSQFEKPVIQKEFFDNFNRLLNGRFLHFYSDNEMFVKALVRVYQRVNPVQASLSERNNLVLLAEQLETDHRQPLLGILETINKSRAASA